MTWNLPIGADFLPDVSIDFLEKRLAQERRAKPHLRLLAAFHRKQGWSPDEIAAPFVGVASAICSDILWRFVGRGLDAAYDAPRSGRHPSSFVITEEEQADLRERLITGPQANGFREGFWTTRRVLHLVEKQYPMKYTREHMTRRLHKLGFSTRENQGGYGMGEGVR